MPYQQIMICGKTLDGLLEKRVQNRHLAAMNKACDNHLKRCFAEENLLQRSPLSFERSFPSSSGEVVAVTLQQPSATESSRTGVQGFKSVRCANSQLYYQQIETKRVLRAAAAIFRAGSLRLENSSKGMKPTCLISSARESKLWIVTDSSNFT